MADTQQEVVSTDQRRRTARLISASAIMAAGTALSRVLGFGRLMLLVLLFGNGTRQAEIFTLANTVPNSMYILLAGGVLNTVLVPQIVRAVRHDPDRGEAYTNRIMTAGLLALGLITVALTLAVPWIIALYSASAWKSPAVAGQYQSMIMLGYYCMPQIFFYGAHVLAGQVLNARDRFGPMMWAPIANNVVSIGVLLLFWGVFGRSDPSQPFTSGEELLLGLGSTLGIAVQAAVLVPFLRSAGYRFRPRFDFRHTGLGKTFRLAKWTLGFVLVTQAALVVVNRLASGATVGGSGAGFAAYSYAYAMWILPHSLITVSLATAMLPSASRLAAAGDLAGVREETLRTMRLAVTALLPAAVAFLVLGVPIARLVFGFGEGARDAEYVGWALMAFAVGLVPFTIQYICLRAFYALEDTRSTFFLQLIIAAVNVLLGIAAVTALDRPALVATGLAAAYSLAYLVGAAVSFSWLARKLPDFSAAGLQRLCVRLLLAAAPAGGVAAAVAFGVGREFDSQLARLLALLLGGCLAVAVFLLLSRLLRIGEVRDIVTAVRRRGGGRSIAGDGRGPDDLDRDGDGDSGSARGASPLRIGAAPTAAPLAQPGGPTQNAVTMSTQAGTPVTSGLAHPPGAGTPDPSADPEPEMDGDAAEAATPSPGSTLPAGTLLAQRYRLEELLAESFPAVTWRALDEVLSRSVLVHLLPPGDAAAPALLAAARQASVATDSRFLRVLDAVHSEDPELGSYIVCEYAVGQSLELILASGPLSGLEAAWVVREVADALAGVHSMGLHHERISPETVIITPAGNIKIVGLLIEAALRPPRPGADGAPAGDRPTGEQADVRDLGRLLYASLVCRWPGGPAFGLAEAPMVGQHWMTPRQVRAGVSPALDNVCDQILGDPPRHKAARLATAAAVVSALTKVLGTADASGDLERRLRQPVPRVGAASPQPVSPLLDSPADPTADAGVDSETTPVSAARAVPATVTTRVPEEDQATAVRRPDSGGAHPVAGTTTRRPRRWIALVAVLAALLLTIGVAAAVTLGRRPSALPPTVNQPSSGGSASGSAPAAPIRIAGARDFDPQGDPSSENSDEVANAYDGDPKTRWRTVSYLGNPKLGGLKRGVGLVFDLGQAEQVGGVRVSLSGDRTDLDIRVPRGDRAKASPPMSSDKRWRVVAEETRAGRTADLSFAEPVSTRYLLVYLTSLPREGNGYRGGIYEVEIRR